MMMAVVVGSSKLLVSLFPRLPSTHILRSIRPQLLMGHIVYVGHVVGGILCNPRYCTRSTNPPTERPGGDCQMQRPERNSTALVEEADERLHWTLERWQN